MRFKKIILIHLVIFIFFTILTQVGGICYILSLYIISKLKTQIHRRWIIFIFPLLYGLATFIIIPPLASLLGRKALPLNGTTLIARSAVTVLLNRNYVSERLYDSLLKISSKLYRRYSVKLVYFDAGFPFVKRFPLLPHLSHHDGRKVDLGFIYNKNGIAISTTPNWIGYGFFEKPIPKEANTNSFCKQQGYWQYDYPKYFNIFPDRTLTLDLEKTKFLISLLLSHEPTQKIFIEPHLVQRLGLNNPKIKFHGCRAVRHDDHIHWQID